jgi:flagellar protein FliJ
MARFKFRMATLLKLREATRDERRIELAQAYRADEVLEGHMEQVRAEIGALREQCRKAVAPGAVDIDRIIEGQRYEVLLKVQERHLGEQRGKLAAEIERRRVALLAANREVRVLEKLREHQIEQHQQAESLLDVKRLDEVARLHALMAEEVT